ncbi:MAG TPA: hypothetical protein VK843_14175 [Planctomycetota bacterium]|nr:hypothetical protein [Planctomycetota bacterium]
MKPDKKTLVVPILLITLGTGWLLTTLKVMPEIEWIWTLALAIVGLLSFALGGLDKLSVALGPFFLVASGLSILRQTGHLRLSVEVPILLIIAGALLLVARLPAIPMPRWLVEDSNCANRS